MAKFKLNENGTELIGSYFIVEVEYATKGIELQSYAFRCDPRVSVTIGDFLVVEDSHGLTIVRVIAVFKEDELLSKKGMRASNKATKWVVDKIDTDSYEKRIDSSERQRLITTKIAQARKSEEERAALKELAKSNPAIAKMVAEIESIHREYATVEIEDKAAKA